MINKEHNGMGFAAILLSAFFLFNPVVAFLDVLPNCVGYFLLCFGLRRLSDLSGHLNEAMRRFRILLLLSVVQLLATYLIYGVMSGQASQMKPYEQPVYILLGTFVMLVLQWYYLIPAFRDFFMGLEHLAEQHESIALTQEKNKKTPAERMARLTSVFVVLSSIAALLPELTILTSIENEVMWYEYVDLFRLICAVLATVVSLIWLVSFVRFFLTAIRDRDWTERLWEKYKREVLPQTGMLTVRRFAMAFFVIQIAWVFSFNLRVNHYALLPSVVFALLSAFAVFSLGGLVSQEKQKNCYLACALTGIVSLLQIVFNTRYLNQFLPEASLYYPDAYSEYLIVRALDCAEAIADCILVAVLLRFFAELIREHTVVDYGRQDAALLSSVATERLHRSFQIRNTVVFALFFTATIANITDAIFRLEYPWIWLVAFVLSFASYWNLSTMLHELKTQIQFRYDSDGVNKKL